MLSNRTPVELELHVSQFSIIGLHHRDSHPTVNLLGSDSSHVSISKKSSFSISCSLLILKNLWDGVVPTEQNGYPLFQPAIFLLHLLCGAVNSLFDSSANDG